MTTDGAQLITTVSLRLVNFKRKKKTSKRTSVIVWIDSHRMVKFITDGGRKEKDKPPPERKLANERDPLVENTITLT